MAVDVDRINALCRSQGKTLKTELDDIPTDEARIDPADISDALSLYASLDRAQRKAFWSRTVSSITVSNSGDFFVRLS